MIANLSEDLSPNLEVLNLRFCKLRSLPPAIGQMKSLIELRVSINQLTHLPPEIGDLENLRILHIEENPIETLPPEFEKLHNLRALFADLKHEPWFLRQMQRRGLRVNF